MDQSYKNRSPKKEMEIKSRRHALVSYMLSQVINLAPLFNLNSVAEFWKRFINFGYDNNFGKVGLKNCLTVHFSGKVL